MFLLRWCVLICSSKIEMLTIDGGWAFCFALFGFNALFGKVKFRQP